MVDGKSAAAQKNGAILTTVKSSSMDYSDKEKMVYYQGNVDMTRPGLVVKCTRMRAYMADENAQVTNEQPAGEIEKIFAYGNVDIVEKSGDRTRLGKGEVATAAAARAEGTGGAGRATAGRGDREPGCRTLRADQRTLARRSARRGVRGPGAAARAAARTPRPVAENL